MTRKFTCLEQGEVDVAFRLSGDPVTLSLPREQVVDGGRSSGAHI